MAEAELTVAGTAATEDMPLAPPPTLLSSLYRSVWPAESWKEEQCISGVAERRYRLSYR